MKKIQTLFFAFLIASSGLYAQTAVNEVKAPSGAIAAAVAGTPKERAAQKVVVITGARFTYPLIQEWIDTYNKTNPESQIIIEQRGSNDPSKYDILVEVYEQDEAVKGTRDYLYIGRYAVLPVANTASAFAKTYGDKGLNKELIQQLFFNNLFADKEEEQEIKSPYTVYTRLQKAGVPVVFANYFGFQQKDIKGKAIAGSDEHLLKSILRDSTAVSYLPLSLAYDRTTRQPVQGISILPVDLNGNKRVADDEKFYANLDNVIDRLSTAKPKELENLPLGYIHLSIEKTSANSEAVAFLRWVVQNGQESLKNFGYIKAEPSKLEKAQELASKRNQ